jgi:integrase
MWLAKKKQSPYWYARWLDPETSVPISKSTGCVGKREANVKGRELHAEWLRDWESKKLGSGISTALVIAQHWTTEVQDKKWAVSARVHLERIEAGLGPNSLYCLTTTADVAKVLDAHRGELSVSTLNRLLAVWRRMHKQARLVRGLPVQEINWEALRGTEPEGRTKWLTRDQVRNLFRHLSPRAAEIALFAVMTGARKGQVMTLTWERVNYEARTVQLWRKHRKAFVPHTVPLHQVSWQIVERRAALRANPDDRRELVFDKVNFRREWEAALKAEGLRGDIRFHDLRHTAGTWHRQQGADLMEIRELLGHSDVKTTQRYSHVTSAEVRSRARSLESPDFDIDRDTNNDD